MSLQPSPQHDLRLYPELQTLVDRNTRWRTAINRQDPEFFKRHYLGQRPEILWIGCSDARVPETTILGSQPGDVFVHRGIANLYSPKDDSLNSVMMIALQNFKVKHIVVAAIQRYLAPLTALARALAADNTQPPSLDLLVEENVAQQVRNLLASDVVQDDWRRRAQDGVVVHGWGSIRDLGISQGSPGSTPGQRAHKPGF
ncbi:hypothetical protein Q5752_002958 [Cryptotrichosporon argae]